MIKVNKLLLILTCSFAFGLYQPECSAGVFKKKKKNETERLLSASNAIASERLSFAM